MLTFFYDLIQLEIKSTNLFRDVNFRSSLKHCSSMDEFMSRAKYYDYPLEKIICKSFIDLHGDHIPSSYDRKSRKSSNTTCLTRIPDYVKYCIKLIMGEIESDIDKTTKYTTVKDLPLVNINSTFRPEHLNLTWLLIVADYQNQHGCRVCL